MLTMAVGHSDDVDPGEAVAIAIQQCRATLGDRQPQAGILFSTVDGFDPSLVAAVRAAFPGVSVMGSSSAAEISSVRGYQEDSIGLALFASDTVDVTAGIGTGLGADLEAACRSAARQALAGTNREPRVCIVLIEAFAADPQVLLRTLARALPEAVLLVGGSAARSDFTAVTPTYQFCNDVVAEDGVAILLFSGPLAFSASVGTGWKTLGPKGKVTRSEHGAVHEIDGVPAMQFVSRYLDATGPSTFGNPLAVFEDGTDDFYLRAILQSDPAGGSLNVMGSVPVGATVQLTTADTEDILSGTRAALARATDEFPAGSRPEAGLIFSCAVRKFLLGSRTATEAQAAQAAYGATFPLAGMYCFGEIGPVKGAAGSRFLNETFVTLLLGT